MRPINRFGLLACLLWGALLPACGGGGGGTSAPTPDAAASQPAVDAAPPVPDAAACANPPCPDAHVLQIADLGTGTPADAAPILPDMALREFTDTCSDIYDQGKFPTFEVEIDDAEWAGIQAEFADPAGREAQGLSPKPYHPVKLFRYMDETFTDAMIRLKGNQYFSWVPPKMQFVISFKEVNPDGRFHGLRKLDLDAPWYDPSLLHERIALAFLRESGVPTSCANNAKLNVNGQFYGVYTNKEHVDKEFLQRNFDDAEGNLYKYGYELKTNEGTADVTRRDQLWASADLPTFAGMVQRDEVLAAWAGEAMLPDYDGYWCCNHNFYVYDEPGKGFAWIPYDLDIVFDGWPDGTLNAPQIDPFGSNGGAQIHFQLAMADATWRQAYSDTLTRMLAFYEPGEFARRLDRWDAQIDDAMRRDPNLPYPYTDHPSAVARMRDFFQARYDYLSTVVQKETACQEGEAGEDLDRDGYGRCTDCDDVNREVHPGKIDVCNGRDDDCNGVPDDGEPCSTCTPVDLDGAHFLLCPNKQSWFDGFINCGREGGTLALPQTPEERAFIVEQIAQLQATLQAGDPMADPLPASWWIGANDGDAEDTWATVDGMIVASPPWAPGRPNGGRDQNCAVLETAEEGLWNDNDCTEPLPTICRLP